MKLLVNLTSNVFETGAVLRLLNLPEGWTASEVQTGNLNPGTNQREIEITIPGEASGEYTLTLEAIAKDFVGSVRETVTLVVDRAAEKPALATEPPKSTEAPPQTSALGPTEAPPVKPEATLKPETQTPPTPAGRDKGGICGPTVVMLLAMLVLVFRRFKVPGSGR